MSEEKKNEPVAEFFVTRTAELPNKQGMQVVASLYKGESDEDQLKRLDRLNHLLDRTRDFYELPLVENHLEAQEKALGQSMTVIETINAKKRGEGKGKNNGITTQEQGLVDNAPATLAQGRENIERGRRDINERRKRLGLPPRVFS